MNDQPDSKTGPVKPAEKREAHVPSSPANAGAPAPEGTTPPAKLTAEEQMALYEESLKESDWGHQPC
jgi:hypothetical protein